MAQQLSRGRTALAGRVDDVARAAAAGLVHERRDVQERALTVLGPLVPSLQQETLDELRAAAADLPAVLRPQAEAALGLPAGAASVQASGPPAVAVPSSRVVPSVAGRPAPGPDAPGPGTPVLQVPAAPVPRLPADLVSADVPVVRDLADLVDAVAEHLEQRDPRSAERVLDGVSRFAAADPAGVP